MSSIAVVYYSGYGHTERLAQHIAKGAQGVLMAIDQEGVLSDDQWSMLDQAKAIFFGSPTYMGGCAWPFKKFADTSSKRWSSQAWKDKLAGGFTISANPCGDKHSTLHYMMTLALQHGMVWVGQSVLNNGHLNRLGSQGGLMSYVAATSPASDIPQGDLETAEQYGERMVHWVKQLT